MPEPALFLTDFGLAKNVATGSKFTRSGETLGTPHYMPPEQARGEIAALSPAGDVWGLGCVLYELLAGTRAFDGPTPAAIVRAVVLDHPAAVHGIPPEVEALLAVMLQKGQRDRPADGAALREDCRRVLAGGRPKTRLRGHTAGLLAGWAVVLVLTGLAWAGWSAWRGEAVPATPPTAATDRQAEADRAWALRHTDPAASERGCAAVLAAAPDAHGVRLRHGLLLWLLGRPADAASVWQQVPAGAPERTSADWYLALQGYLAAVGDRGPGRFDGPRRQAAALQGAGGRIGTLASALGHLLDLRYDAARTALHGVPGWDAAVLRGLIESSCFNQNRPYDAAAGEAAFTAALTDGLPMAWILMNRGVMRQVQGNPLAALEDYEAALRADPAYVDARVNRASTLSELERFDAALLDLEAVLEREPQHALALINRSNVLGRLGRIEASLADAETAVQLAPRNPSAYYMRGIARERSGNVAGALPDYDYVLVADPGHTMARLYRSRARRETGDLAGALSDIERVLQAKPESADNHFTYGRVLMEAGRHADAVRAFTDALTYRPGHAPAMYNRAKARGLAGDRAGAIADYGRAIALDPTDPEAFNNRARLYMAAGQVEPAVADLQQSLKLRPENPVALTNLGLIHDALERWDAAADCFARAIRSDPGYADAHAGLGTVRMRQRRWADAAAGFEAFLRLAPRHNAAPRITKLLQQCRAQAGGG